MRLASLAVSAGVAAAAAHRLTELTAASLVVCAVTGLGFGLFVYVLFQPDDLKGAW